MIERCIEEHKLALLQMTHFCSHDVERGTSTRVVRLRRERQHERHIASVNMAHKIALLYHAINNSKLAREVLRKRIEEHFEDVKDATETQELPTLPTELQYWIVELCEDIANLVREPPNSLKQKLTPVYRYLQATR